MKLWLVRHALPVVAEGVCYGASDVPADDQATREAAQRLAAGLPPGLAVSSSPLARCLQLADALQGLRSDLAYRSDARLSEMNFGAWEQQRWDAIAPAEFERWTADFAHHACGGGESVAQLMARAAAALAEARHRGADSLWITHAGVIRAVSLLAAGVTLPRNAADWPREGLGFGQAACIQLV
ncbi:alpha-ribazole phosphatase [Ramlibacter solisilvae]|uniref:Phosphoglycerate kinase n=1 Tax=Ramlibacter tataouinensis TaxID=94132 RepID=A0A127JNZ9_9BURK|nr:histidine phosphatase family protein [Ramlibacter tataouinensis]AMO21730.1 phosphoglycerate kinase [Ramlibacter tataouinensis]